MNNPAPAIASVQQRIAAHNTAPRWPRNRYLQAALMYPRRWTFRFAALWAAVFAGLICWGLYEQALHDPTTTHTARIQQMRSSPVRDEFVAVVLTIFLAVFLGPALLSIHSHMKDRLTDWRGTVVPNYRMPHLLVGAIAVLTTVVAMTSLFYSLACFNPPALFALTFGIAAMSAWMATIPSKIAALLTLSVVSLFGLFSVRLAIASALLYHDPTAATIGLIIAILILFAAWIRLAFLRQDTVGKLAHQSLRLGAGAAWRRNPGRHFTNMSLRKRVQMWRVPVNSGWMPLAGGALIFLLIAGLGWWNHDQYRDHGIVSVPLACLSILLPVIAVSSQWMRRLPSLGYELARPVTRHAFVRELGLSLAADWLVWWFWLTLGGAAGAAFAIYWSDIIQTTPGLVLSWIYLLLGLSIALQILYFGVTAWVLHFQTDWTVYVTATACVVATIAAFIWFVNHFRGGSLPPTAEIVAVPAIIGIFLVGLAYKNWLAVDIK